MSTNSQSPPPADDHANRGQSLSQLQAAYITALILENDELKQAQVANAARVDRLNQDMNIVTQAVADTLATPTRLLREIYDADGFKMIDPTNAATMFNQPISTERGPYNYWLQRLVQMQEENIIPAEQADHTQTRSRQPRHCACCGQAHADSRTCGKSHTCLAAKCTA